MRKFVREHLADGMILLGCSFIVYATAIINWVDAIYVSGGILIVLGVLVAVGNSRRQA